MPVDFALKTRNFHFLFTQREAAEKKKMKRDFH